MTVKELIEHLSKLDPELRVFTYGYEGGYNDIKDKFEQEIIALDYNEEWYYGKHEAIRFIRENKSKYTTVKGVIL